jgi:Uma2 family endonuclease
MARHKPWEEEPDENRDIRHIPMTIAAFEELLNLPETPEKSHYELINGILYNMASPSPQHQLIAAALNGLLRQQLPIGSPCCI